MKYPFKPGDHVKWNSEAGHVSGKIIKMHTADFDYKGYIHHATKEDPQNARKSDKADHVAVYKEKALFKAKINGFFAIFLYLRQVKLSQAIGLPFLMGISSVFVFFAIGTWAIVFIGLVYAITFNAIIKRRL